MCQDHQGGSPPAAEDERPSYDDPFPWEVGVFDAHCHPTDTMSSVDAIPDMSARVLTVMATRSQDQHLVEEVAGKLGIKGKECLNGNGERMIPCFGWHPWFSHQLYDDSVSEPSYKPSSNGGDGGVAAAKESHYKAVLTPAPDDPEFIAALPEPKSLSSFIEATRKRLSDHSLALVGEVGLDKAFRLPRQWDTSKAEARDNSLTPGGREGRLLSPQRVRMQHQQAVLTAQLRLAGELGRAVSLHGVQAHGVLYDTVAACWKGHEREVVSRRKRKMDAPGAVDESDDDAEEAGQKQVGGKPYPPRLCLHSYSGTAEMLKQWMHPSVPCEIFVSFSVAINMSTDNGRSKIVDVVNAVPEDRILVESDLHIAGERMDGMLEDMYRKLCEIRGWELREGIEKIRKNYERFIFG
ncbi:Cut9-interacting protein scn1 [Paramyrothecium foliicola]|nr:Cut9-interacting protein scn1 [Paramyrothecium foliicola]